MAEVAVLLGATSHVAGHAMSHVASHVLGHAMSHVEVARTPLCRPTAARAPRPRCASPPRNRTRGRPPAPAPAPAPWESGSSCRPDSGRCSGAPLRAPCRCAWNCKAPNRAQHRSASTNQHTMRGCTKQATPCGVRAVPRLTRLQEMPGNLRVVDESLVSKLPCQSEITRCL